MENIHDLHENVQQRLSLALKMESLSEQILTAKQSELGDLVAQRGFCLSKLIALDQTIASLTDGNSVWQTVVHPDGTVLTEEQKFLDHQCQETRAVLNRIRQNENAIAKRLNSEKAAAIKNLETLRRGSGAAAKAYHNSTQVMRTFSYRSDRKV